MRIDDSPEVDSSRLRKFLRSGFHMEQLSGADLSRLIRKILQHETRIAFQNDQSIVTVHSRFEDYRRARDCDRHRFCRNFGATGILSRVDQDRSAVQADAATRLVE